MTTMQRRFDRQWRKNAAKSAKHARLMKRKPELREQLYGRGDNPSKRSPPSVDASNTRIENRETAKDDHNGSR